MTDKKQAHLNGAVKKAIVLSVASRSLVGVICEPGGYCAVTPFWVGLAPAPKRFGEFFARVRAAAGDGVQFVVADGGRWVGLAVRRRAGRWSYEFRQSGDQALLLAAAASALTAATGGDEAAS